jgi:hypothetical protein
MPSPTVVWRNSNAISRRRLWNRARRGERSSLYIVVRSGGSDTEWEGLPNLELIRGGGRKAPENEDRSLQSQR